jgi:hypothetical protein
MSSFAELLAAAEQGAASIYHEVLAVGAKIENWIDDPAVKPLVQIGTNAANEVLTRAGLEGKVITTDVLTGLKLLAAKDATVPSVPLTTSISTVIDTAGTLAAMADPQAAGIIDKIEAGVGVAEGLAAKA